MIELKRSQTVNGVFTIIQVGQRTFVCPAWIEVPADTRLEDISVEKAVEPPKETPKPDKTWSFVGSKGNTYSVILKSGAYTCSCPAAMFQKFKDCKHVIQAKKEG
jgi:hypothetical protein